MILSLDISADDARVLARSLELGRNLYEGLAKNADETARREANRRQPAEAVRNERRAVIFRQRAAAATAMLQQLPADITAPTNPTGAPQA